MDENDKKKALPFVERCGFPLVYDPGAGGGRHPRKHPCPDCHHCQNCSDARCRSCRSPKNKGPGIGEPMNG